MEKTDLTFDVTSLHALPAATADGRMARRSKRRGGDHDGSGNSGDMRCLITLSNVLNGSDLNVLNIFGGGLGL